MCSNIKSIAVLVFTTLSVAAATSLGRIIYVDEDAAGANVGSSWANAYNSLQDALADATTAEKAAEVRIAQGISSRRQRIKDSQLGG